MYTYVYTGENNFTDSYCINKNKNVYKIIDIQ